MTEARAGAVGDVGREVALAQVACFSVRRAEVCQQLTAAVAGARAAGASWSEVGRAAGMTRQSAHERWSSTTVHLTVSTADDRRD